MYVFFTFFTFFFLNPKNMTFYVFLSCCTRFPEQWLTQRRARPYFLEPVWLGSKDSGICWAGSLPKQQPEPLLLQRSLLQEPLQFIFQETEPTSVLQPTPLQQPVADLGFLNEEGCQVPKTQGSRCRRRRGVWRGEGCVPPQNFFSKILSLEIVYYWAFWRHVANISTLQYTQSMNFWHTHVCIAALQGLKINCATLKWLP